MKAIIDDVEEDRREGGGNEAAEAVEDRRIGRHQRHADEIGEADARQQHREVELGRVVEEARHEGRQHPAA